MTRRRERNRQDRRIIAQLRRRRIGCHVCGVAARVVERDGDVWVDVYHADTCPMLDAPRPDES